MGVNLSVYSSSWDRVSELQKLPLKSEEKQKNQLDLDDKFVCTGYTSMKEDHVSLISKKRIVPVPTKERGVKFAKELFKLIFSLGLSLISSAVRRNWGDVIKGKKNFQIATNCLHLNKGGEVDLRQILYRFLPSLVDAYKKNNKVNELEQAIQNYPQQLKDMINGYRLKA